MVLRHYQVSILVIIIHAQLDLLNLHPHLSLSLSLAAHLFGNMLQSPHPLADAVVAICGVIYFSAWSLSFYPQLILNYRRKT
jgi:cystinosin